MNLKLILKRRPLESQTSEMDIDTDLDMLASFCLLEELELAHVVPPKNPSPEYSITDLNNLTSFEASSSSDLQELVESSLGRSKIVFSNLDLETGLFGIEHKFEPFVSRNCESLQSLGFENCRLGLGRLMELLAFCKNLQELRITDSTSLLRTNTSILNWKRFIPYFLLRIRALKSFTIEDTKSPSLGIASVPKNISGWMDHLTQLASLRVRIQPYDLPMLYICRVLDRNRQTLRDLSLIGKCDLSAGACASLGRLNLASLSLEAAIIADEVGFSKFLQNQKRLQSLELVGMALKGKCFSGIGDLEGLTSLELRDCSLENGEPARSLAKVNSLRSLKLSHTATRQSIVHWTPLFSYPIEGIRSLSLDLHNPSMFLAKIGRNFRNLESLTLRNVKNMLGARLMLLHVWNLLKLKKLAFNDTPFGDPDLVTSSGGPCMANLQDLRLLDLSNTKAGDKLISEQIVYLTQLQELRLNGTQVTVEGLSQLSKDRKTLGLLPNLEVLSAVGCPHINLSNLEYMGLEWKLAPIRFDCSMKDEGKFTQQKPEDDCTF